MEDLTFGGFDIDSPPPGALRPVVFPQLARMDQETPDLRTLSGTGGSVRPMPLAIKAQFTTAPGHYGAEPVGTLTEITMTKDGNIAGRGWLVNAPGTGQLLPLLEAKALYRNSVDLADVTVTLEWGSDDPKDPEFWDAHLNFVEWAIAATTFVDVPAFPNAYGEVAEVTASFSSSPLEVNFAGWTAVTLEPRSPEVTASIAGPTANFADFHRPEADVLTPITVDETGHVYGHLAAWGKCHEGIEGRCVVAPRPADYDDFHGPSVLTERGLVRTGPIFFLGGHPARPLGDGDRWAAYGGIENAWADVRVANGQLGPWISGRVRPGVGPSAIYAARASRISGHWRTNGTLASIVSVNTAGYNIPGTLLSADRDGAIYGSEGELLELCASLHAAPPDPFQARSMTGALILSQANTGNMTHTPVQAPPYIRFQRPVTTPDVLAATTAAMAKFEWINSDCGAVGSHTTPTASGSWDVAANEKRLPSPMPMATARKFYAWIESGAGSEVAKSQGKLGHHNVSEDGTPGAANLTACSSGIAILNGGRGGANIPDSDRAGVHAHLAKHLSDGGKEPPKLMSLEEVEAVRLQVEMLALEADVS